MFLGAVFAFSVALAIGGLIRAGSGDACLRVKGRRELKGLIADVVDRTPRFFSRFAC